MKKLFVAILVALVLTASSTAIAGNPADVTDVYRFCGVEFFKGVYDGGPRWVYANIPVNQKVAVSIFSWQNKDNTDRLMQLKLVKNFSSWLDVTLNTDIGNDGLTGQDIGIDLRFGYGFGLGSTIPLRVEGIKVGPRVQAKNFAGYLTVMKNVKPAYGLSYVGKVRVDVSYETASKIWIWRTSKGFNTFFGTLIPETRMKFTPQENFYGFGVGFIPK